MFKPLGAALAALILGSCGGGGGSDAVGGSSTEPLASHSAPVQAKQRAADTDLVAEPASVVNTITLSDQTLRDLGATSDGGYALAWTSTGGGLSMQAYDDAGTRVGPEVDIPVPTPAVAVLTNGSLVVMYTATREDASTGVYFQLFGKDGTRLVPETQVTSQAYAGPKGPFLGIPGVVALSDGGFVVSSAVRYPSTGRPTTTGLSLFWFGSQGQAVGPPVEVGGPTDFTELTTYGIGADAHGGLTVSTTYLDLTIRIGSGIVNEVFHFDANHVSTTIADPSAHSLELLPLEDGYVLFTIGTQATMQTLDSLGRPVGASQTVAFPSQAIELTDGTYVVTSSADGAYTAQRFAADGRSIGQPMPIDTHGVAPWVVALADGGFVAAWTAPGAGGDADVHAQRFIASMVSNAGFESGMFDWVDWGNTEVVSGQASSGNSSLSVGPAAGGAGQPVAGIVPGNTYRLTAQAKVSGPSETVYVGVNFVDDQGIPLTQNSVLVNSTSYTTASVDVVAPPNAATALVYVWKNAGSGVADVDSFTLHPVASATPRLASSANLLSNGGFETPLAAGWSNWGNANTNVGPLNAAAGSDAIQVGTGAGGVGQEVSGIIEGNTYRVSAAAKVSDAGEIGYFGVVFMDDTGKGLLSQNVVFHSTTYSTVQADVTAPTGATKAQVFAWKNAGGGFAFVDEVSLVQVAPASTSFTIVLANATTSGRGVAVLKGRTRVAA